MSYERWSAVDDYVAEMLVEEDEPLRAAVGGSIAAGLPPIALSTPQAKLLHLLARIHGAKRVLELGTLGGYSTIWLARALPADGQVITLELEASYATVAAGNIERAGVADRVQILVGPALDSLHDLVREQAGPFDLIFIDADKQSTPDYFTVGMQLVRPGSVILTDNVVRDGGLADPSSEDPRVLGMRAFHDRLAAEPRVTATTIQTVGNKGYDGFTLALVER